MRRPEAMLFAQAHTLSELFARLARRAAAAEYLNQYETYMRLALKAQSQCRTTLEALGEIKNPRPVAFVKQANISNGPQLVNNGASALPSARAESHIPQNKLLEELPHERLDTGAQSKARRPNQEMEAMATVDRTHKRGR